MVPPDAKAGVDAAQKQSAATKPGQVEAASKAEPSKLAKANPGADVGAQQAPVRDSSKTVFVRALPADASQDQLHLAFSKFGKLRSCRYTSFASLVGQMLCMVNLRQAEGPWTSLTLTLLCINCTTQQQ